METPDVYDFLPWVLIGFMVCTAGLGLLAAFLGVFNEKRDDEDRD